MLYSYYQREYSHRAKPVNKLFPKICRTQLTACTRPISGKAKKMQKAQSIYIREYNSNIEVFASRNDDNGNWKGAGRVLSITCDADTIPSASYVPTIKQLHNDADGYLTTEQCRTIKNRIYSHCKHRFNR